MKRVQMNFGDGTFKVIEVEADKETEALAEARDWVRDNAWFEMEDLEDNSGEELRLY